MKINKYFAFCVLMQLGVWAGAQDNGNSTYSRYGVGELFHGGNLRQTAMGGAGSSLLQHRYINLLNPAALAGNDLTTFEFSVRSRFNFISSSGGSAFSGGGSLGQVAIGMPIYKNHWSLAVGFKPFSTVRYLTEVNNVPVSGSTSTASYEYLGKGDIAQFFVYQGVKVHEHLRVGLGLSYLYGRNETETITEIDNNSTLQKLSYNVSGRYKAFQISPGVIYSHRFRYCPEARMTADSVQSIHKSTCKTQWEDLFSQRDTAIKNTDSLRRVLKNKFTPYSDVILQVGLSMDWRTNGLWNYTSTLQRKNTLNGIVSSDTISLGTQERFMIPPSYRLGIGLMKPSLGTFSLKGHRLWSVAMDLTYQPWEGFKGWSAVEMQNSYGIALGAEWHRAQLKSKKRKVLPLYRVGGGYKNTGILINGTTITDIYVSLGIGLLLPRAREEADYQPRFLDLAVTLGNRGTTQSGLISEKYISLGLGVNVNDRWFVRRRLD